MSTDRKELTVEQATMNQVVSLIAHNYTPNQTNLLITNAKQISNAIMSYEAPKNTAK